MTTWQIAWRMDSYKGVLTPGTFGNPVSSKVALVELGFQIIEKDDFAYPRFPTVVPPTGWTQKTEGSYTEFRDPSGTVRIL